MPDHPTPGQVCYEVYCATLDSTWTKPAWRWLLPEIQRAWEAAAQAMRADRPVFRYALGVQVQWGRDQDVWTIEARRWTERASMPAFAEYGLRRPGDPIVTWAYEADLTVFEEPTP